jgi:cellulose synthase (UDP-forming)
MTDPNRKKILPGLKAWWSDVIGTQSYLRYFEREDRKRRLAGQFLTIITIGLGIYYLAWHAQHINWEATLYSFIFFLAEFIGLVLFTFFAFNAWFLRYHSPQGVSVEKPESIDVFITVAGEPVDIVAETVRAAVNIDYPNKKIYLLDDKGDIAYKNIAEKFGCGYFARDDHSHAKAGNLNYAFERTTGDLILTIDADQIPQPQIVSTLIGYFKFPVIGFVQSKQDFKVPLGDPFGNTDRIFYNVMQLGKDMDNSAFSCGSGVIYRRRALEEIGGFSTWNLVEDVHTSMLLHDRGWRSIYYHYPLSKGTAPADIHGVYRQRRQWAADSLRILFWDNPFFRKGLTFKQKLQYFHLGFVYLVAAFVMPLFFLTPIWALLTHQFVLIAPVRSYVLHRFPYFIAMSLAYGILNYPTHYMYAFKMWTGLFPAFIHATWIALWSRKEKPAYRINVKPAEAVKRKNPFLAILPQQGIIFLSLFAVVYAFIKGAETWDYYLLNVVWSIWSVWTMSGICIAAIKTNRWVEEAAPEKQKEPSLILRARELFITILLTLFITFFFTVADMAEVNESLNNFRQEILFKGRVEKQTTFIIERIAPPPESLPHPAEKGTEGLKDQGYTPEKTKGSVDVRKASAKEREAVKKVSFEGDPWVIQVASVKIQKVAKAYKEKLMASGWTPYSVLAKVKEEEWVRVRVGFFRNREEAEKAAEAMREKFKGESRYWMTQVPIKEMEELLGK